MRALAWAALVATIVGCASTTPLPARGTPQPDASVTVVRTGWFLSSDPHQ
jgi:hypothetical protein